MGLREQPEIDPATGLPKLPADHYWRLVYGGSVHAQGTRNLDEIHIVRRRTFFWDKCVWWDAIPSTMNSVPSTRAVLNEAIHTIWAWNDHKQSTKDAALIYRKYPPAKLPDEL